MAFDSDRATLGHLRAEAAKTPARSGADGQQIPLHTSDVSAPSSLVIEGDGAEQAGAERPGIAARMRATASRALTAFGENTTASPSPFAGGMPVGLYTSGRAAREGFTDDPSTNGTKDPGANRGGR